MNLHYTVRIILVLIATAQISAAQIDSSWCFMQMADPQFGMYPFSREFKKERRNFGEAVAAANHVHPEFVVICGDLIHKAGNKKQITAFKETAAQLDTSAALFLLPGNHDVGNRPTPQSLQIYRDIFGPDYYSFSRHGYTFLILNSTLLKDPSGAWNDALTQERWIDSTLHDANKRHSPIIIFQHHPWFLNDENEKDSYYAMPRVVRKKYLALFNSCGVIKIFSGHLHRNHYAHAGSMELISSGSVGMPLYIDPPGIRIVTIRSHEITHRYYSLNALKKRFVY